MLVICADVWPAWMLWDTPGLSGTMNGVAVKVFITDGSTISARSPCLTSLKLD